MKQSKAVELTPEYMLRLLIHQANGFGAKLSLLKLYRPKTGKYEFYVSGFDEKERRVKMGGTAEWLYSELLEVLVR